MKNNRLIVGFATGIIVAAGLFAIGPNHHLRTASAAGATPEGPVEWSRTGPFPDHDVYYPGTETLRSDEMRVIACGTGMPQPRLKQAAACFLVELGNGDKFVFDMGEGSYERIMALGIPLDQLDKVFLVFQI